MPQLQPQIRRGSARIGDDAATSPQRIQLGADDQLISRVLGNFGRSMSRRLATHTACQITAPPAHTPNTRMVQDLKCFESEVPQVRYFVKLLAPARSVWVLTSRPQPPPSIMPQFNFGGSSSLRSVRHGASMHACRRAKPASVCARRSANIWWWLGRVLIKSR